MTTQLQQCSISIGKHRHSNVLVLILKHLHTINFSNIQLVDLDDNPLITHLRWAVILHHVKLQQAAGLHDLTSMSVLSVVLMSTFPNFQFHLLKVSDCSRWKACSSKQHWGNCHKWIKESNSLYNTLPECASVILALELKYIVKVPNNDKNINS